jgi:acyl-coenzyme A thioesterase PaaI-like protein
MLSHYLGGVLYGLGALWAAWLAIGLVFAALIGKRWQRAKHKAADSEGFTLDQLQSTLLWRAGFGHFLGLEALADISLDMELGLSAAWPYPTHWAPSGQGKKGPLNLAALAGLLDVLSTLDILHADGTHRPGVSVELSLRLTPSGKAKRIAAGERLVIKCSTSKLGATLGFSELAVLDGSGGLGGGEVLAVGSHVKFLPPAGFGIGPVWQTLMHPWVLPWFYKRCFPLWRGWMDKSLEARHGEALALPPLRPEQLARLRLKIWQKNSFESFCQKNGLNCAAEGMILELGPQHANPAGFVHGGAIALAAAARGAEHLERGGSKGEGSGQLEGGMLSGISVQFLSAVVAPTKQGGKGEGGQQLLLCPMSTGAVGTVRAFSGNRCVATVSLQWCNTATQELN